MSKHEIRLRRQRMAGPRAERFRNYGAVLQRHERDVRLKKILKAFIMFLIILIAIVLLVIVVRVEKKVSPKEVSVINFRSQISDLRYPIWE